MSEGGFKKPWSGRFSEETEKAVEEFTASISFDSRLYRYDIKGSIAHCKALEKASIITSDESDRIISALQEIEKEIEEGKFEFSTELEDIHMHIEKRLIEKIGELGGKLHTGRSRNDQVVLDMRLYLADQIEEILSNIRAVQKVLLEKAKSSLDIIMPGYTHLQMAQPVMLSHYLIAFIDMLDRDRERFLDCLKRVKVLPSGSGALAGIPYDLDRYYIAELLGFPEISKNSIDAVSDRDFLIEFASSAAITMVHLGRLSEDFIIWASSEFGFIEIPDKFSTGSSIMPQKKNPDVFELIRGKTGRIFGNLQSLLVMMKGLPLSYNRDMQEDKEAIFDTVDTLKGCLKILVPLLDAVNFRKEAMLTAVNSGFLTSTDLADYLVRKGVPFRKAHEIVGNLVKYCISSSRRLSELTLEEMQRFSPQFEIDALRFIDPWNSVNTRSLPGGTARICVEERIREIERQFAD